MSVRNFVAEVTAGAAVVTGPVLAGAEAGGVFAETSRPFMVYVLSGCLTLLGLMFTALIWFVKKEYESITGGIKAVRAAQELHNATLQTIAINTERGMAELRGEVGKRMLIEEHGRSSARVHEKVNKLARIVSFLTGKLGLPPEDTGVLATLEEDEKA